MHAHVRRLLTRTAPAAVLGLAMLGPSGARSESAYPNHPIKLVLGFPPGGATDAGARRVADQLGKRLGQPIVVENRPGASGNIAAAYAAKAPADGYTLFYGTNTTHAMNVSLYRSLGYDPVKDFVPIMLLSKVWNVLSVNPDFKARSLPALLALAKAEPGTITIATPGNSTSPHMALKLLESSTGIQFTHVPYKGSSAALPDVISGQVPVMFDNLPTSFPFIRAGKLKALAISSPKRLALLPDVPTFDELGIKGYEVAGWGALWAPAGTPAALIERLNRELNEVIRDPKVVAMMEEMTTEPQGGTPELLAQFARAETLKWQAVVRANGIRLD